jgi:DNA invertase Pin-like site-specific DNA recombinase
MISRKYDPEQPFRYVRYGRMSGDKQNPRSPDQQFDTAEETRTRAGYPWVHVRTYRDDAISGKYVKKRPGLQTMLRDIELGVITVDLIVVDTLERFGRAEEIAELRRKLYVNHGVLVVAADNHFADPTGVTGKAIGLIENIRSTEDGRVKAHNVIRGKKDAVRLKKWPGGRAPMGFRLKKIVKETDEGPKFEHEVEVVPAHIAAVRAAFRRAADTGHGPGRLPNWWNTNPEIPDELKPMYEATMRYILKNEIYIGRYVWGKTCTDIIDDTRKREPNPDGPHATVDDFCEATVDPELFDRVQVLAAIRAEEHKKRLANKEKNDPEKLIAPQVAGISLTYLLVGLVRCGRCKSSMRPIASGRQSKAGKKYVYFTCPRKQAGACGITRHVPEDKLRAAVIGRFRARLFPPPDQPGQIPDWYPEIVAAVEQEIASHRSCEPDRLAAREAELRQLDAQLKGWLMNLGDLELPATLRADIVSQYDAAKARRAELDAQLRADRATGEQVNQAVDPAAVLDCLRRLDDVLAGHNLTLGNLELSKHIDRILCYPDGGWKCAGPGSACSGARSISSTAANRQTRRTRPPKANTTWRSRRSAAASGCRTSRRTATTSRKSTPASTRTGSPGCRTCSSGPRRGPSATRRAGRRSTPPRSPLPAVKASRTSSWSSGSIELPRPFGRHLRLRRRWTRLWQTCRERCPGPVGKTPTTRKCIASTNRA